MISKKRYNNISDRTLQQIANDINELIDAVNRYENITNSDKDGKIGDLRVVREGIGKAFIMARTEEGWFRTKSKALVKLPSTADETEEIKSHTQLTNIGIKTHPQIDAHIADTSIHGGSGLFDIDIDGGLEPSELTHTDNYYELDGNDDIMPKV